MMDLQELIRAIDLPTLAERAGANFGYRNGKEPRSHCPIHKGTNKTSFVIFKDEEEKQHYFCHTCNAGGDALDLYRWMHSIPDIGEAAKELAKEYGLPLDWTVDPIKAAAEEKRRLRLDVLDGARTFYKVQLWGEAGKQALAYLQSRGFTDDTIQASGWGFSDSRMGLHTYLKQEGFDLSLAAEIGLIRSDGLDFCANANGAYAAPHGWIVMPNVIHGRTTHFTSRAVEVPDQPRPEPKDKSRNLPGDWLAYRAEVRGCNEVILTEGPADAYSLYQMGFTAWGLGGLGKLDKQSLLDLKKRKAVYLSVDGDQAGQDKITRLDSKIAEMCNELGPLTMILPKLPFERKDHNDWLKNELEPGRTETIKQLLCGANTWLEVRMEQATRCSTFEREARMLEVGKLLGMVPTASRSYYYGKAQKLLNISKQDVRQLINNSMGKQTNLIRSEVRDGMLFFDDDCLGNFHARITRELMVDNGQDPSDVRLEIIGGLDDGTPLAAVEIDASEFTQLNWVPKRWGATPTFYCARKDYYKLIRAIQEISQEEMIREKQFAYTGWSQMDGGWSYLVSNGKISATGLDTGIRVDLGDPNLSRYELPAPPVDPLAATRAVRASIDFLKAGKRRVTAIIWAAMYAAPLTSITPLFAMLWIYGQTQTGKSTITMLGLTHFGKHFIDEQQYHAPAEWLSSFAGLEDLAFTLKDTCLVIDDYAPRFSSKAEATEQSKTAQLIIRTVGNRSAKKRSRNYEKSPRPPRAMVISTAENPLIGQSTVGRVIYVPVNKGDVIFDDGKRNELLNEAQRNGQAGLYAEAMVLFIQWMAKHYDELKENMRTMVGFFQEEISKANPKIHPRLPNYYGVLCASQHLALSAFVDMKWITQGEAELISKENREAISQVIVQQSANIGAESPVRKVFTAIHAMLERGTGYLSPRKPGPNYVPPVHSELIGWYDPGNFSEVWFNSLTVLELAKRFWGELDENLDIREDMLKQQLNATGVIHRGDGDHIEKKVIICGRAGRYLEVDAQMVETLFDVQILPERFEEG
jgi:DNA primase